MKHILIVSAFLMTSLLSQSQWSPNGASIYYNGGNVGVGTSSPNATLHLYQPSGSTYLKLDKASSGSEAGIEFSNATAPIFYIFSDNTDDDALKIECVGQPGEVDATPRMAFPKTNKNIYMAQSGGNVGIGTTNPTAKLAVKGDILCTKVKVVSISNFPDYVFHPSYRLRPLSEVAQYIQQHHHLPEVPSAAEVEKNGLDLGDNQATLLKKIEELTLYVIEQNNINKAQAKKLDQQQREIESLKKIINKR